MLNGKFVKLSCCTVLTVYLFQCTLLLMCVVSVIIELLTRGSTHCDGAVMFLFLQYLLIIAICILLLIHFNTEQAIHYSVNKYVCVLACQE